MIHDIIKKLQTLDLQGFEATLNRARDRNRTGTVSLQQDFKSCASASSATRAYTYIQGLHGSLLSAMGGEGFEPSKALPADLQSVPFGHSGIHPYETILLSQPLEILAYHVLNCKKHFFNPAPNMTQ